LPSHFSKPFFGSKALFCCHWLPPIDWSAGFSVLSDRR
jgi:hypothetical protein